MQPRHGPRPKGKIHPSQLAEYERSGDWIVQRKFNGKKTTIFCDRKSLFLFNKGELFRSDIPLSQFNSLRLQGECWLDGELLKNRVVLYDILQYDGEYLIGITQEERLNLLDSLCVCTKGDTALQVTDNIWLAEHWDSDFEARFEDFLDLDSIEGLVLRKKKSKFSDLGFRACETEDQIRCRKGNRKYRF